MFPDLQYFPENTLVLEEKLEPGALHSSGPQCSKVSCRVEDGKVWLNKRNLLPDENYIFSKKIHVQF